MVPDEIPRDAWEEKSTQDTIYFDATVRRSGNSLVITIPPELARRFLIPEGQKVRLLGAVKHGFQVEGMISVYLGRFEAKEVAPVLKFKLKAKEGGSKSMMKLPDFLTDFAKRHSVTETSKEPTRDGGLEVKLVFGSLVGGNVIPRSMREVRLAMSELPEMAQRAGYELLDMENLEEEMPWENVDPAHISRFYNSLEGRVRCEWVI